MSTLLQKCIALHKVRHFVVLEQLSKLGPPQMSYNEAHSLPYDVFFGSQVLSLDGALCRSGICCKVGAQRYGDAGDIAKSIDHALMDTSGRVLRYL